MEQVTARNVALVVYAALYLIPYRHRTYYIGAMVITVIAAGAAGLEYLPALWLMPEFILWFIGRVRRA